MSNNKKYFRHDAGARNDDKLTALRIEHGPAGYGVYFMLLERLREEENYRGDLTDRYIKALAYDFHADAAMVRSVIKDFQLFKIDDKTKTFSSPRFDEEMQYMEELSRTRQAAASRRWNDANALENDANASKLDANAMQEHSVSNANAMQNTAKNTKTQERTTTDNKRQQKTQNANALENDANALENDANASSAQKRKIPPTPPYKEKTRTEQEQNDDEGLKEGEKEEIFLMPDETPKAAELRARLKDVDWPEYDIDEFMRMADYGENAENSRAIKLLARFETDRMKYEPTRYTPSNIMSWLKSEERSGELQPQVTLQTLQNLRHLRRLDIAEIVKVKTQAWLLHGTPEQREERSRLMAKALADIEAGAIRMPDAFLISTMKKA